MNFLKRMQATIVVGVVLAGPLLLTGCSQNPPAPPPLAEAQIQSEVARIQSDPKMNPVSKAAAIASLTGQKPVGLRGANSSRPDPGAQQAAAARESWARSRGSR
jgi:hypothetical protein